MNHSNTNQSVSTTGCSILNMTGINITFWLILERNFLEGHTNVFIVVITKATAGMPLPISIDGI
jgi:hypothetical protein